MLHFLSPKYTALYDINFAARSRGASSVHTLYSAIKAIRQTAERTGLSVPIIDMDGETPASSAAGAAATMATKVVSDTPVDTIVDGTT